MSSPSFSKYNNVLKTVDVKSLDSYLRSVTGHKTSTNYKKY